MADAFVSERVDIQRYGGAAVGVGNAVHVQPGTGATFTVDSELPAAAALADNTANPTVPGVGAFLMAFDGTNWDRAKGDSTDGLLVNLGANNDVSITGSVDTELPAAASLTDDFANPTAPAVGAFGMLWDGATWDRMPGNSADGVLVNLGTNNDVTFSGAVDTELPAAAALADATANPTTTSVGAFLQGFNGTTWDRVRTANTGRLQVDVVTGGGESTPTTPVVDPKTSASLAAGASVDVDSTDVGTATKKLRQVVMTSSAPFKAVLSKVSNGTPTIQAYFFGAANESVVWEAPHRNYITQGDTGAGFCGFRTAFTNLHNVDAADVYVTYLTEE